MGLVWGRSCSTACSCCTLKSRTQDNTAAWICRNKRSCCARRSQTQDSVTINVWGMELVVVWSTAASAAFSASLYCSHLAPSLPAPIHNSVAAICLKIVAGTQLYIYYSSVSLQQPLSALMPVQRPPHPPSSVMYRHARGAHEPFRHHDPHCLQFVPWSLLLALLAHTCTRASAQARSYLLQLVPLLLLLLLLALLAHVRKGPGMVHECPT